VSQEKWLKKGAMCFEKKKLVWIETEIVIRQSIKITNNYLLVTCGAM